jgi:hypothetical protein
LLIKGANDSRLALQYRGTIYPNTLASKDYAQFTTPPCLII